MERENNNSASKDLGAKRLHMVENGPIEGRIRLKDVMGSAGTKREIVSIVESFLQIIFSPKTLSIMRNWLFTILLAAMAITFVCCNQKEELPIVQEDLATETLPEALQGTDGVLYGEINEEGEIVVDLTASKDDYDGAAGEGREYCVYNLRTLVGNPFDNPCPLWHAIGFDICVNCPDNGRCPGIEGKKTRFRFIEDGEATCVGAWILKSRSCIDCPPDGKTGYRFVN